MNEDTRNLTALQMLDRLNQAIEESGIHEMHEQRQPLALFQGLLNDWYLSKGISIQGKSEAEVFADLLKHHPLNRLQKDSKRLYFEAIELSRAHKTLTVWTRRELDQYYQQVQSWLEQGKAKKRTSG